jgi:hypothetical protein
MNWYITRMCACVCVVLARTQEPYACEASVLPLSHTPIPRIKDAIRHANEQAEATPPALLLKLSSRNWKSQNEGHQWCTPRPRLKASKVLESHRCEVTLKAEA